MEEVPDIRPESVIRVTIENNWWVEGNVEEVSHESTKRDADLERVMIQPYERGGFHPPNDDEAWMGSASVHFDRGAEPELDVYWYEEEIPEPDDNLIPGSQGATVKEIEIVEPGRM